MSRKSYWFHPKTHTGWSKNQSATTRRRKLLNSTPKTWSMYHRYITAAKRINALANVTKDIETKRKARADANYFFKKARKLKK